MKASSRKPLDAQTIAKIESGLAFPFPKEMVASRCGVTVAQVRKVARQMGPNYEVGRAAYFAAMEKRRKLYIEAQEQQQAEGSQDC